MIRFRGMKGIKWAGASIALFCIHTASAQVTGGNFALEFLRLPNSPHITALGGINVANPDQDISFAMQNPSLMRPGLHNQLALGYNAYYAGISVANLNYGYHDEKLKTSFALGIQYLDYGQLTQTDAIGNELGEFNASDMAVSIGASRSYKERWRYGAAVKFANSVYQDKSAMALLADVGVTYYDTANLITVGAVAKNMGATLKKYNPANNAEPLPFDLQLGVTKRFKHLPLRVMATLHHLYEWDVRYNNPADVEQNNLFGTQDTSADRKSYFVDKLFRHFIFGGEFLLGKRIAVSVAYNHLRRGELAVKDKPALAGFSFGLGLYLNKVQVHYARSYYHVTSAYNEFGFNFALNKLLGIGKTGQKINWGKDYDDWPAF